MITIFSFLHILDGITDHLKATNDRATLMALRATCKSLHGTLTPYLLYHVKISGSDTHCYVSSVHGAPGITAQWAHESASSSGAAITPAQTSFLQTSTVFFLEPTLTLSAAFHLAQWPTMQTLRCIRHSPKGYWPLSWPPLSAHKEVFFRNLTATGYIYRLWLNFNVRETTKTVVVHVSYDPALDPCLDHNRNRAMVPRFSPGQAGNVVIALKALASGETRPDPVPPGATAALTLVLALIWCNANLERKFTVVGMESADWRWLGFEHEVFDDDLLTRVRQRICHGIEHDDLSTVVCSEDEKRHMDSLITFLTLEEYEAQVGPLQFKVDTDITRK
ncbi:uncharacterized protein LOC62_05G006826 [Vanrija pseudolonga]|uniref:Uncharacterized protein n=1 Tax=Vanrija pseudolonga TaxID=143232 RepID=A0AAF0YC80_9TREE|nr:hypothetical protein LOC62_05G006826 [Vanrija pseudolonga]